MGSASGTGSLRRTLRTVASNQPCSPAHTVRLTRAHDRQIEIAPPRPPLVCSRTDIEPHNHRTDTPATMAIDTLSHLSFSVC